MQKYEKKPEDVFLFDINEHFMVYFLRIGRLSCTYIIQGQIYHNQGSKKLL